MDAREFTVTVLPATENQVAFAVNGSRVHKDDVGGVGLAVPVGLKLFLHYQAGNTATIKIKAADPARVSLTTDPNDTVGSSEVTIQMTEGTGSGVYAIPRQPSVGTDDIVVEAFWMNPPPLFGGQPVKVGEGKLNGITVEIGSTGGDGTDRPRAVDAVTTPKAMVDALHRRIPPRNWNATTLWVKKTGDIGAGKAIYLYAPVAPNNNPGQFGQNDLNGRVALRLNAAGGDGDSAVELTDANFGANSKAPIQIRGHVVGNRVYQTARENGGRLYLKLYSKAEETANATVYSGFLADTAGFSVAAIPHTVTEKKLQDADDGTYVGFIVRYSVQSDSGELSDLDAIYMSEAVRRVKSDINATPNSYLYLQASIAEVEKKNLAMLDFHARAKVLLNKPDVTVYEQLHLFIDLRTGAIDVPVSYSGFKITYEVKNDTDGKMKLFLKKEVAAVAGKFPLFQPGPQGPAPRGQKELASQAGLNDPVGPITGTYSP